MSELRPTFSIEDAALRSIGYAIAQHVMNWIKEFPVDSSAGIYAAQAEARAKIVEESIQMAERFYGGLTQENQRLMEALIEAAQVQVRPVIIPTKDAHA